MINLLPLSQKEELKTDRSFKVVNLLGMVAVFVLISFALAILAVGAHFDGQLRSKTIEAEGVANQLSMMGASGIEKTMSDYGVLCKNLNNFYKQSVSPADVVKLLAGYLPQGIEIIHLSTVGKSIHIDGISKNRSDLLELQDSLAKARYFKNVNIPPSDWVTQENISFNATVNYDPGQ